MAKIEKPAKAEKDIVKALKEAHASNKTELAGIDKLIADSQKQREQFLKDAEKQLQAFNIQIATVTLRKKELIAQVAKNTDILGE
jgi:hypothetical protein